MKHNFLTILFLFCILTFAGCGSDEALVDRKNPMETGRNFIESLLKGDFESVTPMLQPDKENESALNTFRSNYKKVSPELKSDEAIRSWKMEKWEEKDENYINFTVNHEMFAQPVSLSMKKIDGIWFVNFLSVTH